MRPRWHGHRPSDTLGVATLIAATSIDLGRPDDDPTSVCVTVGASPLRAAAWLRGRGAALGHAASHARIRSNEGATYDLQSRTIASRSSGKTVFNFTELRSEKIAEWLTPKRVAIALVGAAWPTCRGNDVHALVIVGAAFGSVVVFDPAGDGPLQELPFATMDGLRAEPNAAWEVLLVAARKV